MTEDHDLAKFKGCKRVMKVGPVLLQRLRAETRIAHQRIERDINVLERLASGEGYRTLLERFYGFYATWEIEAQSVIADPEIFRGRHKLPLLEKDLRALGASDLEIAALPLYRPLMPLQTRAAAFGAMYVMEGSTLGGTIIAKQAERLLGVSAETGCAYFYSYGRDVSRMWKAFCDQLVESAPDTDDLIVVSANETFEGLRAWLAPDDVAA